MTPARSRHVTPAAAAQYAAGTTPDADAWSLEQHVETCGQCAARVSRAVRSGTAGPQLARQRAHLLHLAGTPQPPAPALAPTPALRTHRLLWALGPALRLGWVVSVLAVALGAVLLAFGAGQTAARPLLLAVAPVVPLAGVALSHGRRTDPLHELHASMPGGNLRLLLHRTACALGLSIPVLTAAGAVLPPVEGVPGAAAWLLPGLALTLGALALGSWIGCRRASAAVGSGWALAVTAPAAGESGPLLHITPYLDTPAPQVSWAVAAVACAVLLLLRRTHFDRMERV
ncbi:zf-HC2 domain-containing protein [Streptomyces sp. NPDC088745]|uniref:zf-HC2 domain-containing protein n=1 Tax=Streptomyces sp. NPDC088745 TaxID=3365884 RepID=UPI00381D7FC2